MRYIKEITMKLNFRLYHAENPNNVKTTQKKYKQRRFLNTVAYLNDPNNN